MAISINNNSVANTSDKDHCVLSPPLRSFIHDVCFSSMSRIYDDEMTIRSEVDATLFIIKNLEGGYANLSGDRGGETLFGVSSNFNPSSYQRIVNYLTNGEFISVIDEVWTCYSQYSDNLIDSLFARGLNHCGLFLLSLKLWGYPYNLMIKHLQKNYNSMFNSSLIEDGVAGPLTFGRLSSMSDTGLCKLILTSIYYQADDCFISKFLSFCDKYPMFSDGFKSRVLKSMPLILIDAVQLGINVLNPVFKELCTNSNFSDGISSVKPYNDVIGLADSHLIVSSIRSERLLFTLSVLNRFPVRCQINIGDFVFDSDYKQTANKLVSNLYD